MKVSVQFPMHTKSENVLRSLPFVVANAAKSHDKQSSGRAMGIAHSIANAVKKQRREVRMILDSQLPRLRNYVEDSALTPPRMRDNFYRVTLIRISAGELDTDGLHGALKAVRDEVAAWLGIDDSARSPASWRVGQQKGPAKVYAVRIEIEDDDPDTREVHRIVGGPIAKLGPVVGDVQHAPRGTAAAMREIDRIRQRVRYEDSDGRAALLRVQENLAADRAVQRQEQVRLVFRRSYYAPPGQDEDADEVTLEELTGPLFELDEPPLRIIKGGRELRRRRDFHPALGEHWIYEAAPRAARPTPRAERAEARR